MHHASNANRQKSGCCCSGKSSVASTATDVSGFRESSQPLHLLQVQGATCGGCVKSVEQTLKSLSGVSGATMDLATGVATVFGAVDSDRLIGAISEMGYGAEVITE